MKRQTDCDKWKKPFFKSLNATYKLFWLYLLDECDNAGIWQADFEVASIRVGAKVDEETMLKKFGDRVQKFDTDKFFLPDFIQFHYGELQPTNRFHASVIKILEKYAVKGHTRGLEAPITLHYTTLPYITKDLGKSENPLQTPVSLDLWKKIRVEFLGSQQWMEEFCMAKNLTLDELQKRMEEFCDDRELAHDYKSLKELKGHFLNLYNKKNGTHQQTSTSSTNVKQQPGTSEARIKAIKKW